MKIPDSRWHYYLGLLVLIFTVLISCSKKTESDCEILPEAREKAEQHVNALLTTPYTQILNMLNMEACQIFGRDLFDLVGGTEMKCLDDQGTEFEAITEFWFKGRQDDGVTVKRIQEVVIHIKQNTETLGFQIMKTELGESKNLTTGHQIRTWIKLTITALLLPLLIVFWILATIAQSFGINISGCFTVCFMLLLVPLSGYYSYVCFHSWVAVAICVIIVSWLALTILGQLFAAKKKSA